MPRWIALVMAMAVVALSGCITVAPDSGPAVTGGGRVGDLDRVTLRMDWLGGYGYHAAFHYGLDEGFYREEGIELEILEGQGSSQVLQLVGNGSDTFGFADAVALPRARVAGIPVRMIAGLVQQTPFGVLVLEESGIREPADLVGKTLAATPGGAGETIFPAMLQQNGVDPDDITYVNVPGASKNSVVVEGTVDGSITTAALILPRTQAGAEGKRLRALSFSEFGANTLSFGIVTSEAVIDSNPDLVRRFVRATQRSWEAAAADPEAAIAAQRKTSPDMPTDVALQELQVVLDAMHTERSQGRPVGWMAEEDWEQTLEILVEFGDLEAAPALEELYTNDFVE